MDTCSTKCLRSFCNVLCGERLSFPRLKKRTIKKLAYALAAAAAIAVAAARSPELRALASMWAAIEDTMEIAMTDRVPDTIPTTAVGTVDGIIGICTSTEMS